MKGFYIAKLGLHYLAIKKKTIFPQNINKRGVKSYENILSIHINIIILIYFVVVGVVF